MITNVRATVAACAAGALLGAGPGWAEQEVFAGQSALERQALVQAVLERNPDLRAGSAMLAMARARVPQVSALMDPMLSVGVAPWSLFGMPRPGVTVELEQQLPFPGKLGLRGLQAEHLAEAAGHDLDSMRLEMALQASLMFDGWYQLHRALEVNAHHLEVMSELKRSAELQYGVGMGSQQDPLKAELELARMERERLMLQAERQMMQARLNAMLRRAPDAALPPPAPVGEPLEPLPPTAQLRELALRNRPELKAVRARLGGAEAMVGLAGKAWLPDFGVMAGYTSMWEDPAHQYMAAVTLNLPLQFGMRRGMEAEANAELAKVKAEEQARIFEIAAQVEVAVARLEEAKRALSLHNERLVPTARAQLAAARVSFEAGRVDFMALIEAENNLRELEFLLHAAAADVHRRRAELERALGRLPGAPAPGGDS